jgi:hypothetical protein
MPSRKSKSIVLMAGLACALALAAAFAIVLPGRKTVFEPLPSPNGFDLLLEAAKLQQGNPVGVTNMEAMADLVATNQPALALVRRALTNKTVLPLESYIHNYVGMMADLRAVNDLALTFRLQASVYTNQSNYAAAAESYCDMIHLSQTVARGFIIHKMAGGALEGMGTAGLLKIADQLPPTASLSSATNLLKWDSEKENFDLVEKREGRFMRASPKTFQEYLTLPFVLWRNRDISARTREKDLFTRAKSRLLALHLVQHAFESENKTPAKSPSDLVPRYLSQIPLDPFSSEPLRSIATPSGIEFYSVGPDRTDNQGTRMGTNALGSDFFLTDKQQSLVSR